MSPDHGFPALAGGTGDDRIAFGSRNGGALVDLMDIDPSLFNWEDICTGLARIPRFAGQTDTPVTWSVADHLLVCDQIARIQIASIDARVPGETFRRAVLFHDVPEFITSDIPRPVKDALACLGGGAALSALEAALDVAVRLRFGCDPAAARHNPYVNRIKQIDRMACDVEIATIRPDCGGDRSPQVAVFNDLVKRGFVMPKPASEVARMCRFAVLWQDLFPAEILREAPKGLPRVYPRDFLPGA